MVSCSNTHSRCQKMYLSLMNKYHMKSHVCLHVWVCICTHYIHVPMWLWCACTCLSEGSITHVCEHMCHGRVTALTLSSEL